MKLSVTLFALILATLGGLTAKAGQINLRDANYEHGQTILASTCGNGEREMMVTYTMGNFGMGIGSVKVYITFNGRPVASAYTYNVRGSQATGFANFDCSIFQGHGEVALYFVDDNGNHDDDFGRGYRFEI